MSYESIQQLVKERAARAREEQAATRATAENEQKRERRDAMIVRGIYVTVAIVIAVCMAAAMGPSGRRSRSTWENTIDAGKDPTRREVEKFMDSEQGKAFKEYYDKTR